MKSKFLMVKNNKIIKHKLDYQITHDYILIGIQTILEDCRLAYYLNKNLTIKLNRKNKNINFDTKNGSFANFDYENENDFFYYNLISNKQNIAQTVNKNQFSIFNEITNTYFLIPEKKKIDYFFKIEGDLSEIEINEIIKKIKTIYNVILVTKIDLDTLKSKEYLIL